VSQAWLVAVDSEIRERPPYRGSSKNLFYFGGKKSNLYLKAKAVRHRGVYSELVEVGSKEGVLPRCIAD